MDPYKCQSCGKPLGFDLQNWDIVMRKDSEQKPGTVRYEHTCSCGEINKRYLIKKDNKK